MSKLTDFFPSGGAGAPNAYLVLVGGGAGNGVMYWGGGGGGQLYGKIDLQPGVTFPVTIGAGGASGNASPTCWGCPGGKGSPGGNTSFGKYKALGGGAAGMICWVTGGPTYPFCNPVCPCCLKMTPADHGGNGGIMHTCSSQVGGGAVHTLYGSRKMECADTYVMGSLQNQATEPATCNPFSDPYNVHANLFGRPVVATNPSPTCVTYKTTFFDLQVGGNPYGCACGTCTFSVCKNTVGCSRYNWCTSPLVNPIKIAPNANTGHAACATCRAGDSGVAIIVYPCPLGAAASSPGAVNCTPVTGPLGFRSYKFTSSGSFTL